MRGLLGIAVCVAIAAAFSEGRRRIVWRVVLGGLLLQAAIAGLFLKVAPAVQLLVALNRGIAALQSATDAGTTLVFGFLGGGQLPYAETTPARASPSPFAHSRLCW